MLLRFLILATFILWLTTAQVTKPRRCLTGSMTDVQTWVAENGSITPLYRGYAIDLSQKKIALSYLQEVVVSNPRSRWKPVRLLSLATCHLTAVPPIFLLQDNWGRQLSNTLRYISLYNNYFGYLELPDQQYTVTMNATDANEMNFDEHFGRQVESTWDLGFRNVMFSNLRELDLRSCSIQYLQDKVFEGMPLLQSLYLSENSISYIQSEAFSSLSNLIHLDLSHNLAVDKYGLAKAIVWESYDVFSLMKRLASLDLSFTKIGESGMHLLKYFGSNFKRLSLCYAGLHSLDNYIFNGTSIKYLDISGNIDVLSNKRTLGGLENTLVALYADNIGLKSISTINEFANLEILKLSNNEISVLYSAECPNLNKLKFLNLDNNKITMFKNTFSCMQSLIVLSLRNNTINLLLPAIIRDIEHIRYVAISRNTFVCNCYAREFFEIAANNENKTKTDEGVDVGLDDISRSLFKKSQQNDIMQDVTNVLNFHTGINDFILPVARRKIVKRCRDGSSQINCKNDDFDSEMDGDFLLFDYAPKNYQCLSVQNGKFQPFSDVKSCNDSRKKKKYYETVDESWTKLIWIVVIGVVTLSVLIIGLKYRKNFRYFLITVKNSALLSIVENSDNCKDVIYHYDVFVSYCNEDRSWVLDHLLSHVEQDCNVSVCLHERDFQVGLSILENIVSCMDRSRFIMLVISRKFLLSQWCQFEMHLAQHRLLETRREDLILILLEDIPRRLRPNTLQYLMLTKTYCQWSTDDRDQELFWRRLKKCVITHKMRQVENVSLV